MGKSVVEVDAKKMGFIARGIGLSLSDNIFGKTSKLGKAWEKGWKERDNKKRGLPK